MAKIIPKRSRKSQDRPALTVAASAEQVSQYFQGRLGFLSTSFVAALDLFFLLMLATLMNLFVIQAPIWFSVVDLTQWRGLLSLLSWGGPILFAGYSLLTRGYFVAGWIYNAHFVSEDGGPVVHTGNGSSFSERWSEAHLRRVSASHPLFRRGFLLLWIAPLSLSSFWISFLSFQLLTIASDPLTWEKLLRSQGFEVRGLRGNPWAGFRIESLNWQWGTLKAEIRGLHLVFPRLEMNQVWRSAVSSTALIQSLGAESVELSGGDQLPLILEHLVAGGPSRAFPLKQVQIKKVALPNLLWKDSLGRKHTAGLRASNVEFDQRRPQISFRDVNIYGGSLRVDLKETVFARSPFEVRSGEFAVRVNRTLVPDYFRSDLQVSGTLYLVLDRNFEWVRPPVALISAYNKKVSIQSERDQLIFKAKNFRPAEHVIGWPDVHVSDLNVALSNRTNLAWRELGQGIVPSGSVLMGGRSFSVQLSKDVWGKRINEDHPLWTLARPAPLYLVPKDQRNDLIALLPPARAGVGSSAWLLYLEDRNAHRGVWTGAQELLAEQLYGRKFPELAPRAKQSIQNLSGHFQWKVWEPRWDKSRLPANE